MMSKLGKTLVVDGSFMLHRCLRAKSLADLKNSAGDRTGGIFGFLRSLTYEMKINGGYFPIICWDEGLSERRTKVDENYKHYKEKRDKSSGLIVEESVDDEYVKEYRRQRNTLIILLSYMGIPSLKFLGVEGDDIMKTIVDMSNESIIISDDSDMLQLLSEKCRVRRPKLNEMWELDSFLSDRGLESIRKFIEIKALTGDDSDNIPSAIKGVGDVIVKDYMKLFETFYVGSGYNFDEYPKDEITMRDLCKCLEVRYKKAFLNLDPDRFAKNIELVDLSLVHFDEDKITSILSTIGNSKSGVNYFAAIKGMSELEIKEDTVSVDNMINWVSMSRSNMWGDDDAQ